MAPSSRGLSCRLNQLLILASALNEFWSILCPGGFEQPTKEGGESPGCCSFKRTSKKSRRNQSGSRPQGQGQVRISINLTCFNWFFRSQLAFTPRVLATSSTAKGQAAAKLQPMKFVKPGAGVKEKEGEIAGDKGKASNGEAPKSNADFRSMFLK